MASLQFRLLGPFEVHRDGRPLSGRDWRSRQTRTILKVLLSKRGRPVAGEQLMAILWPNEEPAVARRRLHVRISDLRRTLAGPGGAAPVRTLPGGYAFDLAADIWVDFLVFEAQAERGRRAQEQSDLVEACVAYETALALYRGDFLADDVYADWTFAERERLRERYLMVLVELAEVLARQGRLRRAISTCRRLVSLDACRESAYLRLMLYLHCAGERVQALRVYERCRQVLADELGVEPLADTMMLAEQIRAGDPDAAGRADPYPLPCLRAGWLPCPNGWPGLRPSVERASTLGPARPDVGRRRT